MKSTPSLVPDSGLQSVVESFHKAPGDNPVQQVLRAALERLGPNGERWGQGGFCSRPTGSHCVLTAIDGDSVPDYSRIESTAAGKALIAAVGGYSIHDVYKYNDIFATSFADIRAMFHRAITLAGQQVGA